MKKEWLIKTLVLGIVVLLFVGAGVVSALNIDPVNEIKPIITGNWFYVGGNGPGNYSDIQDAIDNATDGDTVFVYNGFYNFDIFIIVNKSIEIIGENKENTIINGSGFWVNVSNVNISGFNIKNCIGIFTILNYSIPGNCNIYDNIFELDDFNTGGSGGVTIGSTYNTVYDNIFINCGLWVLQSPNFVYNNTANGKLIVYLENISDKIIGEAGQVILFGCKNITIENQQIQNSMVGVQLFDSTKCFVTGNQFNNNYFGIISINSEDNIITGNLFFNNSAGLVLVLFGNNTISKNSFENNMFNLLFQNASGNHITYNNFNYRFRRTNVLQIYSKNKWNGNYWNKPRILPVRIWGYKLSTRWFLPLIPNSLDIDWHPAKEPNNISFTINDLSELQVITIKTMTISDLLFLEILKRSSLSEVIISKIINL